jgi:hypothetical protein
MVLKFELVFFSSMGYVYLQLQDKIFQKFQMQSLYLIHFLYLHNQFFLDLQHTFHDQSFYSFYK